MGNPALDYYRPTLTGPNSIVDRFSKPTEVQTGANILSINEPKYSATQRKYAFWQFVVNETPLSAVMTSQDGRWFAEINWLNLFGEGDSPSDAILSLSDHIEHYIEFYSETRLDELTDHAKETRDRFASKVFFRPTRSLRRRNPHGIISALGC